MRSQKIGLLGGTFDPLHNGHLNLAFELMEKKQLDVVWFIPTQINPHKMKTPPTPMEHRLEMVKLAIQEIPQFYLKDVEKHLPSPSYTVETLRTFIAETATLPSPPKFYLLMGEDAVPGFIHWHLPEEVIRFASLLIGSRSCVWQTELDNFSLPVREAIQKGLTPTRLVEISSTEIRRRLAHQLYCGHLLPAPVLEYIKQQKLYLKS